MTGIATEDVPHARRVMWSNRSRRDLENIQTYIGLFAPLAALRFTTRLMATVESLSSHPFRGRIISSQIRELTAVAPYLVRYRVTVDEVQIIWIKHGAQSPR